MANEPEYTELTVAELEQLEKLTDKHRLSEVIYGLQQVCLMKAEHLAHNWQDVHSAQVYNEVATKLEKLGVYCSKLPSIG